MSHYSNFLYKGGAGSVQAESVFEAQNSSGNQSFVEWFSGDVLDSIWTTRDISGTSTYEMNDAVDGGFRIITNTLISNTGSIDFNGIQQYDQNGCTCVWLHRQTSTNTSGVWEMSGHINTVDASYNTIQSWDSTANSFIKLQTGASASITGVDTTVSAGSGNLTFSEMSIFPTWGTLKLNGSFEALGTSDLPTLDLAPKVRIATLTTASRNGDTLYCEAWNH